MPRDWVIAIMCSALFKGAVAAWVEPDFACGVARPSRNGGGAGEPGVGVAGAKPVHSGGLAQDHRRGQHPTARDGQYRRSEAFDQVTKLPPQGVDLHGQLSAASKQLPGQPGNQASDRGQLLAETIDDAVATQPAGANPQRGVEFVGGASAAG